ncbi:o-succinylbenzoate synthase [Campylobacter blaseri]|uniref:O-succinylbenzoate synthase n=1 Tax=Campylobacter blaseri TaxID=2042961 RepID=A0A2P8QZK2_9BACT|nr:o-succinylbenzoate synthase [Campylobacter blaseri]PSM51675.1 o-succinylbenzoate synthase [Campylobacter blaseri]PSM53465.1 o-succinylbenzoate synthase [Campylobacter blaseri]QKF86270.1 o-succinylbenzoate synthase [Campylobacter blaseri]
MKVKVISRNLQFKRVAKTSRKSFNERLVWYVVLQDDEKIGVGECAPIEGLSAESEKEVEIWLKKVSDDPIYYIKNLPYIKGMPSSVKFALEVANLDLNSQKNGVLFPSKFSDGKDSIKINGLIWMGDLKYMQEQIQTKLENGYKCIKLKIGALNFNDELNLIKEIRKNFNKDELIIRVDANGGFSYKDAIVNLEKLAKLDVHSIEQPIPKDNWTHMRSLCDYSVLDIALDEELIGVNSLREKEILLDSIKPKYLVLKPSLHGGLMGCDEWINLSKRRGIKWWITSYLESNLALNAISQWAYMKNPKIHQGLGTGGLFLNNISSPLYLDSENLHFDSSKAMDYKELFDADFS